MCSDGHFVILNESLQIIQDTDLKNEKSLRTKSQTYIIWIQAKSDFMQ